MDIHVLHRQGFSIKAIARKLSLSKNTVKKYLRQPDEMPITKTRKTKTTKLCPYKPYILERIDYARPDWIPAAVLLNEIKKLGYDGGITQLRQFVRPYKKVDEEPVKRFETEPGQQLQMDFTTIRKGRQALKAFVATLGYSRASYVQFYEHEKTQAWIDGLINSFHFFQGVPAHVLCDNAKAIILERNAYDDGEHRWNRQMLEVAKDYGFQLKVCQPYRAQTKGKVERFNGYLKSSFITPLSAELKAQGLMLDVDHANAKIGSWLTNTAHQRQHGTTDQKPQILLDKERPFLQPIPALNQPAEVIANAPAQPMPYDSLQHPLSEYDRLLGVGL